MQLTLLSHCKRLFLAILICTTLLSINVTSAVIQNGEEVKTAEKAIDAIKSAGHWFIKPYDVPSLSSPRRSVLQRLKSFFSRVPIKISQTGDATIVANRGTNYRMVRFGSKDNVFVVAPRSKETFHGLTAKEQEYIVVHRVPSVQRITLVEIQPTQP
ncbi:hypothetical protein NDA10_003288 [Ustilago hordei]|uniref:Uncharacterized protein n=1 Tax=Ustilago hordei TaxID=120017 RepID=I2FXE5_USTHO|nr:uncharacterized protein UHO2_00020 [Ustilago hordei]KAJ1043659.1 hypothetical protein NDA10_003288 [Ustilago hordei]KAJ1587247.1 hypothetical protein NDA15_003554 [Ustilago hordei]KAJ1590435.1 hypothetical protein NDA12_007289 [Ustilago hordei]UTT97018.1 hypothetical protein NDA17_006462 [Ustilago hordei]CCF51588.1 uncharacterized protein UHOR_15018 [Ustilago hordei]